jgi:D-alanyl-lipoteichoic acid acyltransferase DltB (MBOAT superfamily)
MLWGFFKKVVIADRLAKVVEHTFLNIDDSSSLALCIGAALYSFQIYCDFSGYSDIAIGAAKVMNIGLMENFNQPYLSRSMSEFWTRWHISLSSWFRDYLYIPLGGNRKGEVKRKRNMFIVFILSGLWHGANFTFIVWGALHGALVSIFPGKKKTEGNNRASISTVGLVLMNFIFVTILWIFFRSENIAAAWRYIRNIFAMRGGSNYVGMNRVELVFSFLLVLILLLREKYLPKHYIRSDRQFYGYTAAMVVICYFLGVFSENQFIYFQF